MTEPTSDRKDPPAPDPEGEWDNVVRRISERIKRKKDGAPTTQSGLDLAGELVRLERRAREAEAAIEREREVFAARVREMEDKLRKLEPWIRQLKGEYQKASAERDKLREELSGTQNGVFVAATEAPDVAAIESARVAAVAEAAAARTARDAAVAEAAALRARIDQEKSEPGAASNERVAAAEKARDQAVEDLGKMRKVAVEHRRAEDEVRRLLKQIEQLETTTSAHKAVARAAQEAVETLQTRITEMERASQVRAETSQKDGRRAEELATELGDVRAQLVAVQLRLTEAESTAAAVKGGEAGVRRELELKAHALTAALTEIDEFQRVTQRLRGELDEALRDVEAARAESAEARSRAAEVGRQAESSAQDASRLTGALETAETACRTAREEAAAARLEAAETRELCDEAMRAEAKAKEQADESSRARDAEETLRHAAEHRAEAEGARAAAAESRVAELEAEIELVKNQAQSLRSEAAETSRTLESERQSAAKRFDAAETGWRSQMRAAESRFETDVQRERDRAREAEDAASLHEEHRRRADLERESEMASLRASAMQFVAAKAQELVTGLQKIVGEDPAVVPPITATMDVDPDLHTPTATVIVPPPVTGEWDRLISDVEQLWSEVEGMRRDDASPHQDTDSMSPEETAAAAGAIQAATLAPVEAPAPAEELVLEEAPALVAQRSAEPPTVAVDEPQADDGVPGRRKRRRR